MQDLQKKVLDKVAQVKAIALEKFGVDMSNVEIRFNITSDTLLGQAQRKGGNYIMRFSPKALEYNPTEYIESVVPHELAHILCYMKPTLGKNHDAGYRRVATALGDIRHGAPTTNLFSGMEKKVKERYLYRHHGRDIYVGPGQHRSLQAGKSYRVKFTGKSLLASEYVGDIQVQGSQIVDVPKTPKAPASKPAQAPAGIQGMSTAAQIRRYLETAYTCRADAERDFARIVEVAMSFGIRTRGAAQQCVKANIPRCF